MRIYLLMQKGEERNPLLQKAIQTAQLLPAFGQLGMPGCSGKRLCFVRFGLLKPGCLYPDMPPWRAGFVWWSVLGWAVQTTLLPHKPAGMQGLTSSSFCSCWSGFAHHRLFSLFLVSIYKCNWFLCCCLCILLLWWIHLLVLTSECVCMWNLYRVFYIKIILSANRDNFTFYFLIWMPFFFFLFIA